MPELPEVEHARRVAHAVAVGRRIVTVRCARDPLVFDGRSAATMKRALVERQVIGTDRHGKYLWLELDERPWPVMHFGMTGGLRVRGGEPLVLAGSPKEPDRTWPPRFWKLHLVFDDGGELVMTAREAFGLRFGGGVAGPPYVPAVLR
jgi:formamidopyrimidine-DNA glycosylase